MQRTRKCFHSVRRMCVSLVRVFCHQSRLVLSLTASLSTDSPNTFMYRSGCALRRWNTASTVTYMAGGQAHNR